MHIEIQTAATISKTVSIKREKDDNMEYVIAHLKFTDSFVQREAIDELCGYPIGWSNLMYDEQGAPGNVLEIMPLRFDAIATGVIKGIEHHQKITLAQASLTDVKLVLCDKGAMLSGELSWRVAGDEVSDLEPLLGRICLLHVVVQDGGQQDMLKPTRAAAEKLVALVPDGSSVTISSGDTSVTIDKSGEDTLITGDDPLYDDAKVIVIESGKASISHVQRVLKIGYNRAARLIERMEAEGHVGPIAANGTRVVNGAAAEVAH